MGAMNVKYAPDTSHEQLAELTELARVTGFDLFQYIKLLSDAGAPVFRCEIDTETASATGDVIATYKLSEALIVIMTALRAKNVNPREVCGAIRATAGLLQ